MLRGVVSLFLVALFAAVPAMAQYPATPTFVPNAVTPDGPATLGVRCVCAYTTEGRPPEVLTGVQVTVGAGGRGGPVRARVNSPLDPERGTQLGPWVDLPAAPGTYTLAAPALHWDYRSGLVAIDQQTGGHTIVVASACQPLLGPYADPCQLYTLGVFHDLADGDPAIPTDATPAQRLAGQRLAVWGTFATDLDGDRVPDADEHADLRVSATRAFVAGESRLNVTVHNAGPDATDLPIVAVSTPPGALGIWHPACVSPIPPLGNLAGPPHGGGQCTLAPLPVGASRTVSVTLPRSADATPVTVAVDGEGVDPTPADTVATIAPPPLVVLHTAARQRGVGAVHVTVRAQRGGNLRVTALVGGRLHARSVRVNAPGLVTVTVPVLLHRTRTALVRARLTTWSRAVSTATQHVTLTR